MLTIVFAGILLLHFQRLWHRKELKDRTMGQSHFRSFTMNSSFCTHIPQPSWDKWTTSQHLCLRLCCQSLHWSCSWGRSREPLHKLRMALDPLATLHFQSHWHKKSPSLHHLKCGLVFISEWKLKYSNDHYSNSYQFYQRVDWASCLGTCASPSNRCSTTSRPTSETEGQIWEL